jgi:membrane-associated protein
MSSNITAFAIYVIKTFGYLGVGGIIFAESGLLLGFILPGDSLIFLAGLLASQGFFNIAILLVIVFVTAVAGDNVGYFIGKKLGRKVFQKENFIFNQKNLQRTEGFFERHGKSTFLIQRFIPVIRAFAPLLAGVGKMHYRTFFWFDLAGCALWSIGVTLLGYFLGVAIPNIDRYLFPAVLVIIVISLVPTALSLRKGSPPSNPK